jgi:hypothetical protein
MGYVKAPSTLGRSANAGRARAGGCLLCQGAGSRLAPRPGRPIAGAGGRSRGLLASMTQLLPRGAPSTTHRRGRAVARPAFIARAMAAALRWFDGEARAKGLAQVWSRDAGALLYARSSTTRPAHCQAGHTLALPLRAEQTVAIKPLSSYEAGSGLITALLQTSLPPVRRAVMGAPARGGARGGVQGRAAAKPQPPPPSRCSPYNKTTCYPHCKCWRVGLQGGSAFQKGARASGRLQRRAGGRSGPGIMGVQRSRAFLSAAVIAGAGSQC